MSKIINPKAVDRKDILNFLSTELNSQSIRDYCPNGMQVEGQGTISRIVSGVTASLDLIEHAINRNADTILVHHGYFWRGEDACITGYKQKRIKLLLQHNINLLAYHLPLDLHPKVGNNVQLAKILNFTIDGHFGEQDLGCFGKLETPHIHTVADLSTYVQEKLSRKPLVIGDINQPIGTVAWCTGAAQEFVLDAARAGATVYLTGEVSEQTYHEARESGIAFLSCGHHATERYGVKALGDLLAQQFGIHHEFIDLNNPI